MKHWFLPLESNNHKANLLKPVGFALLYGIYFLNCLVLKAVGYYYPGVLGYSSEITAQKVLAATNAYRVKNNLSPLTLNSSLTQSATAKANDMFTKGYWAHNSPDGTSPWQFFKDVNYKYSFAGENLAKDFYDTQGLMDAWINSPTHKANLVGDKYQEIGIGVVNGTLNGYKTTLVVQHFGTPLVGSQAQKDVKPKTLSPQAVEPKIDVHQQPVVEAAPIILPNPNVAGLSQSQVVINPRTVQKVVGSLIFMLLVGTLFIDAYLVLIKNKTHRLSGSSLAHMVFLVVAFIMLLLTQQGSLI